MSEQPVADTGDVIRARHWDMYKPDGSPDDRFESLLSALGTPHDAGPERITADQQRWLESSASQPAPPALLTAVRRWLRGHGG